MKKNTGPCRRQGFGMTADPGLVQQPLNLQRVHISPSADAMRLSMGIGKKAEWQQEAFL